MAERSLNQDNDIGQEVAIQKVQAIGASSVLISGKKRRKSIYIRNIGTDGSSISLSFSNTTPAAVGAGIILNQNEFIIDSDDQGYKCWTGDIFAIASTASGSITIFER